MTGDSAEGYNFVSANTVGCKSNYRLGTNLCSAVSNRLTGAAATWWDDYDCSDKPVPNCWKKALDPGFVPPNVVEVSLYDLLVQQFDPTVDAQQAELELANYRWNPLEKNALGVIPFRGHVSRLCSRAGKTGWAMKGIAIRNTFPEWLRARVMVSKSEDTFWDELTACVNTEMADRLRDKRDDRHDKRDDRRDKRDDRKNESRNGDHSGQDSRGNGSRRGNDKSKKCLFCGFNGHEVSECRRMKAAAVIQQQELQGRDQNRDRNRDRRSAGANAPASSSNSRPPVVCYNCNKPGHISTNCPEPRRLPAPSSNNSVNFVGSDSSPVFLNVPTAVAVCKGLVDEQSIITDGNGRDIELPIYHVLSQIKEKREVFSLPAPDVIALGAPSGVLHSFTRTKAGQKMLTVWDTGAVYSLVPMSTVTALGLSFVVGSDKAFVAANGSSMKPLGYCTDMYFLVPESTHVYTDKVYVVESAPFQLLLGVDFLNRHWAGVFLPWAQVTLCLPHRVEIACSVQRPQGWQRLSPEVADELDGISRMVKDVDFDPTVPARLSSDTADFPASDTPMLLSMPMEIGRRNLVAELDDPVNTDFRAVTDVQGFYNVAKVSWEFIKGIVNFGPTCPLDVVEKAVDLVLQHWDQFSWHEMDLGCIQDVPYDTAYTDASPCSCKSRRHNYAPRNAALIEAKSRPLIDMGVYRVAGPDVVDRAQLVVVRSKPDDPDNPRFARIAHDFRCKNDKAVLLPVPMATREEMYAFLPKFKVFWKTDADRGFLQIVQASDAVRHTGFEMFGQLWVSERMLFGQINGPAFFELNFNVMAHQLKFVDKSVKNFFDDVVGGAQDWPELLSSFQQLLLCAKQHGWKFKPAKTYIGWEDIEVVGSAYRDGMVSMTSKSKAAVAAIRPPRTLSEVRSVLGLFNQFRDCIPGYALRVQALTHLTRLPKNDASGKRSGSTKVTMTVEALEELEAIKLFLVSPAVLVVFQPSRKTYVYSDASLGSLQPGYSLPGGLGGVVTQIDPADGKEYVCAFASAGLTPAMRNYPTIRLEVLAFVFMLSKFYDWLEGVSFVWRTDAKAHKYIVDNRHSPNPALNRYFIGLQAFRFTVQWIPGLRMIADAFSRMVVVADGEVALDVKAELANLVFGNGSRSTPPASSLVPASSLFTWSMSSFPADVGEPARCLTMVTSHLCLNVASAPVDSAPAPDPTDVEAEAPLPLTALPAPSVSPPDPSDGEIELGNPHTFHDPIYSAKARAKLVALPHVRRFLTDGFAPANVKVARWVKWLARQMKLDNDMLWKVDKSGTLKLQVLDSPRDMLQVLKQLHDGLGHRGLASVYNHFRLRYWTPCASKVIRQYIQGCPSCQRFAAQNKFEVPGYQV